MPANDESIAEISEQAAVWWVLLTDERPLSCEQRRQFCQWLLRSRRHMLEFVLVCVCEERLTRALRSQKGAERSQSNVTYVNWWQGSSRKSSEARRHHPARWRVAAAALVVLSLSFFVASDRNVEAPRSAIATTISDESRTERLADGSEVSRDARSTLRVDFTDKHRDVRLYEGKARFNIAEDMARPFRVRTFLVDATVAAPGTNFSVEVDSSVFVRVHEGVVELARRGAKAEASVIRLKSGESRRVDAEELRAVVADGRGGSRVEPVDG